MRMSHACTCAADKEWKRKFYQEKKFTSTLEDRIKKMKDDLQQVQAQVDRRQGHHLKGYNHYDLNVLWYTY